MHKPLNIWQTQSHNYVNGPGCRFVIWVQGCHLACPDCWNKHTWSFQKKKLIEADALFAEISQAPAISGVTLTGGEPFVQAKNLLYLASRIKNELNLNLQIFTGYELDELKNRYQRSLLEIADVVVSGRFDPAKPNNNQKVSNLHELQWEFNNTDVEIEVDSKGDLVVTGYPPDNLILQIKEAVHERIQN